MMSSGACPPPSGEALEILARASHDSPRAHLWV